jgi:hypothetical protein
MLQIVASLTDDSRCVIYERNIFIIQASVLALAPWVVQAGKGLIILIVYAQGIKVSITTFCYHSHFQDDNFSIAHCIFADEKRRKTPM